MIKRKRRKIILPIRTPNRIKIKHKIYKNKDKTVEVLAAILNQFFEANFYLPNRKFHKNIETNLQKDINTKEKNKAK